jgi:putative thioredoxin
MSYELKDFDKQVIERSREVPVVVDFWAPWCGPCKMLGPVLEEMAGKAEGRWELVKVNTEDHPKIALDYQISGIPDVRVFLDGKAADGFQGFRPEADIEKWLKPWLPSLREAEIKRAREQAAAGRLAEAIRAAAAVLDGEPDNERLRLEIAEWEMRSVPHAVVGRLETVGADSDHADKAQALRDLAGCLTALTNEKQAQFVTGRDALAQGDFAAWINAWLEALERDRKIGDGRLLEAGKAAFRFLGPRHPVAEENYRRFTFLLY